MRFGLWTTLNGATRVGFEEGPTLSPDAETVEVSTPLFDGMMIAALALIVILEVCAGVYFVHNLYTG